MILLFKIILKDFYRIIKSQNGITFLYLVLRYSGSRRFQKKKVSFNGFNIVIADVLSFIWQYKEIFVDRSYEFKTNSKIPFIIDCGANVGISVLFFKMFYPDSKVIAYEANPEIAKILRDNMKSNNIKDVEVVDKAVWITNDFINMSLENADNSSIVENENGSQIPCVRLKNVLTDSIQNIDMLKIDIEGAETEVLLDCRETLNKVRNLFVEYHSFIGQPQRFDQILKIITVSNFRYYINTVNFRSQPFVNLIDKNNPEMDLQLNIYAYRIENSIH